MQEFSIIRKLI